MQHFQTFAKYYELIHLKWKFPASIGMRRRRTSVCLCVRERMKHFHWALSMHITFSIQFLESAAGLDRERLTEHYFTTCVFPFVRMFTR